jgi:hypothetical protein
LDQPAQLVSTLAEFAQAVTHEIHPAEPAMSGIEVWRNGKRLFVAGLENGLVDVRFIIRNQIDPMWLNAVSRDQNTGGHVEWAHTPINQGDEFILKVIDLAIVPTSQTLAPNPPKP